MKQVHFFWFSLAKVDNTKECVVCHVIEVYIQVNQNKLDFFFQNIQDAGL